MSRYILGLALALGIAPLLPAVSPIQPDPGPVAPDPGPVYAVASDPAPQAVPASFPAVAQFSFRAPRGHTHTCAKGHTWDHAVTDSHNCPHCGLAQHWQDPAPRPVLVAIPAAPTAYPSYTVQPQYYGVQPFAIPAAGCANGQCGTPSQARWRLLPYRR